MMADKNPLVSIIIPVYNGSNFMREAIDSALAQTYNNIEIIVINDGSCDEGKTRDIALSYGERIRYFEKENGGVSSALNLGLREMRGAYFSWLSHDDWYLPEKVEMEIEALRKAGNMDLAVYSECDFVSWPEGRKRPTGCMRYGKSLVETGWAAVALGLISGCTLLIPKTFFDEYGGFDESLRAVQDYQKWFEMFRDKPMAYVDRPLVCSRVHEAQVTNTYTGMQREDDALYCMFASFLSNEELQSRGLQRQLLYALYLDIHYGLEGYPRLLTYVAEQLRKLDDLPQGEALRQQLADKLHAYGLVYVYCAGRLARRFIRSLRWRGVHLDGVSDSNQARWGTEVDGLICVAPHDIPKHALLIVANLWPDSIQSELVAHGFQHVQTYRDWSLDLLRTPIRKDACEVLV